MNKSIDFTPALAITASDVRGLAQAGFDAAVGITDLVEAVHHTIVRRAGLFGPAPRGQPTGATGLFYRSVRGTIRLVVSGMTAVLGAFDDAGQPVNSAPGREAVLAILNGLWATTWPIAAIRLRSRYHWDLQKRRDVGAQLCAWLARPRRPRTGCRDFDHRIV